MINVYKSDTGQFVLVHVPSQMVIIDESLEQGFDKMQTYVEKNHPELMRQILRPFDPPKQAQQERPSGARFALLAFFCLMPFIWLGALHYSLTSLADEYIMRSEANGKAVQEVQALRNDVDALRQEVGRVGAALTAPKQ